MHTSWLARTLDKLLQRTGGWYPIVVTAIAQLVAIPGAIIGTYTIQLNADFTPQQYSIGGYIIVISTILGNLILLLAAGLFTRISRKRLSLWKDKKNNPAKDEGLAAWRESTSFAWHYGLAASIVTMLVDVAPNIVYQSTYLEISYDQAVYTIFGGIVSIIGTVVLSVLVLERLMIPARKVLVPEGFDDQISGSAGLRIFGKLVIVLLAIILFTVLLIAPIGYRQTVRVLYTAVGSQEVLTDLQTQSIALSIAALALGALLAYLISRSVSQPVSELIRIFEKVQAGDLTQRAPISATDEIGELAVYFNRMITRLEELQGSLEKQVNERTSQLQATLEVGQIASAILDPDQLMHEVVELITSRFGYYYVAIFLVDPTEMWAVLREATGTVGQTLKPQRYRLQIGGRSMVGLSISTREARVAMDVGLDAYRFNNPLLPETRSEIALPLLVGDRVIGALNVQSREPSAFNEDVIETLEGMVNQVAIALENARLFQETRESLEEIRAIHQQYVTTAWVDKMRAGKVEAKSELPGIASKSNVGQSLSIPLLLREQQLGEINIDTEGEWTSEDKAWISAVATQVATSLENARLIEESQQAALRERLAAEITEKIWSSTSIDGILQTAIRELGRSLEASDATIKLELEDNNE